MTLNDFLLNESGIKIPKGTKVAKIIYHKDLDGIFSAILAKEQLKKQGIKNFKFEGIQYGDRNAPEKFKKLSNKHSTVLVDFSNIPAGVKPDYWSDHHITKSELNKRLYRQIGREEFPSETEHLATLTTQNLADSSTIKAISIVDSAKYSNLDWLIDLPKDFRKKGRMERLAIIVNSLISGLIKKNPTAVNLLIKNTNPSLVNLYNNALKYIKLSNLQKQALDELKKPNPDWKKIDEIRNKLPEEMKKETIKGKNIQEIPNIEDYRKKHKEDLERNTNPKTTQFKKAGIVLVQTVNLKNYPSRYLGSLLSTQDLKRYPFLMKDFPTMIQVSLNPDLAQELKNKINLDEIRQKVMQKVKYELGKEFPDWAFDIISRESGGHSGITNINALGTLGLMPKQYRETLNKLKEYENRFKRLKNTNKRFKEVMPQKYELIKKLEKEKERYAQDRKKIKEFIKQKMIEELNKLNIPMIEKPLKNQKRFTVSKNNIKEEIIYISKTL